MKEKNDDGRGAARIILRAVFPVLAAAGIAGYFIYLKATGREITVANIVEHAPKSALPAAAVLLVLYVIKSLSVFFPVTVLYAVGGYMLGPVVGCIVNALGVAMGFVIQYRFGSASGHAAAGKISAKHPRIAAMLDAQSRSPVFAVFSVRLFSVISPDLISYYFGAVGVGFGAFMLGSILGVLPGLAAVTVFGTSATDPSSPLFIISAAIAVAVFALTAAGRYISGRKNARERSKNDSAADGGDNNPEE